MQAGDLMKKVMKVVMTITLVVILIAVSLAGRFYYSVYASEYDFKIDDFNETINIDNHLRIGTYNVHSLNYSYEAVDNFVTDIQDLNLDIICLQEVDQNAWRSGNYDMVSELAAKAGYTYYHFYSTMWIINGYYGIGILSKYPITAVSSKLMPNSLFHEPRVLTKTTVKYGMQEIDIYNTHVAYDSYHASQLDFIEKNIDFKRPVILAGDFNYFYGYNERWKTDIMASVNDDEALMTYGSFGSPDNIYYSSEFKLIDRAVKKSSFSDHDLLFAEFLLG